MDALRRENNRGIAVRHEACSSSAPMASVPSDLRAAVFRSAESTAGTARVRGSSQPRAHTDGNYRGSIAPRIALAIAAVVVLAVWDEARESSAALEDFAQEQATLASAAAGALSSQLDSVRRDAILAASDPGASTASSLVSSPYVRLRVRSANERASFESNDWHAFPLSVAVPDGRWVDLQVPMDRLLARLDRLERPDNLLMLVQAPQSDSLRTSDGRVLQCDAIVRALHSGRSWVRLERTDAAALGLPARTAVAGIAAIQAGALGRWATVVVASASRVRDRESRARWRLVLGVMVVGSLVLAFGGLALRTQRKEMLLQQQLALAGLQRQRDEQLEREGRAATMLTLAAGMAHEVSSPLSVIAGRAEQLAERLDDARNDRAVRVIMEQSERIRDVVQGFLRLARGDVPALDRVDPATAIEAAADLVRHRFDKADVALEVRADRALPRVRGDLRLLEHALINLLLNACDACKPGGRVEIAASRDERHALFTVLDDGEGIRPEVAARVLEPFFSTKPSGKGSGLGLAVANEIVKIHRGLLVLEPRPGRGTSATLRVPIADEES